MATMTQVFRGLKAIRTVAQARAAVAEALNNIEMALDADPPLTGDLKRSRTELRGLQAVLGGLPASSALTAVAGWPKLMERAWVNIFGAVGAVDARRTVSLGDELLNATKELPDTVFRPVGRAVGEAARVAGDAAGGLLGGALRGLGPLMVALLAIVIYVKWFR